MSTPLKNPQAGGSLRRGLALLGRGLRAEKGLYVLAIGGSALYGAGTVAGGWLIGNATNTVVTPALTGEPVSTALIWRTGVLIAVVGALTAVGVVLRRIFAGMAVYRLQASTRRSVTRQYLRLPLAWHRRHSTGQLLSNANADVEASFGAFMPLPFALGVMVMLAFAAVAMWAADPVIAIAGLVVLPLVLVVNTIYERSMSPRVTLAQELRSEVADVAHESFEAALLVKSLGREAAEEQRFEEVSRRLQRANIDMGRVRSVFDPVIDALPMLGTLAVLGVGAFRVSTGDATTGAVVTAAYLLTVMAFPVRAIGFVLGDLPRSLAGWERVERVLSATAHVEAGDHTMPPGGPVSVAFEHVNYHYQAVPGTAPVGVLTDIDIVIPAGSTVALVGATGSGKSTLASLLVRADDPTSGRIRLDRLDLAELSAASLADTVTLVPQSTFLFEDTIRGNVTLSDGGPDERQYSDDEVWQALRTARIDSFVASLPDGLDTRVGERGASLSGGQRQRVALARALIRRPRLLILDDATSAVDPAIEQEILAALREGSGGATVLLIAYRMATIALADDVIHLEDGRVVDRGTHAELVRRDLGYRELAQAYEHDAQRRAAEEALDLDDRRRDASRPDEEFLGDEAGRVLAEIVEGELETEEW